MPYRIEIDLRACVGVAVTGKLVFAAG